MTDWEKHRIEEARFDGAVKGVVFMFSLAYVCIVIYLEYF